MHKYEIIHMINSIHRMAKHTGMACVRDRRDKVNTQAHGITVSKCPVSMYGHLVIHTAVNGKMANDTASVLKQEDDGCTEANGHRATRADMACVIVPILMLNTLEHGRVAFKMAMALKHMPTEVGRLKCNHSYSLGYFQYLSFSFKCYKLVFTQEFTVRKM
jgi:hypothetical protein